MTKPVKTTNPYEHDIGDIDIYGLDKWVIPFDPKDVDWENWTVIPVQFARKNPWKALRDLGVDTKELFDTVRYECPIMDTVHTTCSPYAIIAKGDASPYLEAVPPHWREMFSDKEWMQKHVVDWELSRWDTLTMGSGNTHFILPSDGSNGKELNAIELDNGDILVVWHFVWYNK